MSDYTTELIEAGIILLAYHTAVTSEIFRRAAEEQVRFAAEHVGGDYVVVVDYTGAALTPSAFDFRLNTWAAKLDPHMISALLISQNVLVSTATNLVQRLTHKANVEIFHTREEALERARVVLAEHRTQHA